MMILWVDFHFTTLNQNIATHCTNYSATNVSRNWTNVFKMIGLLDRI